MKQSFTNSKLLSFKNFESLVFDAFLSKTENSRKTLKDDEYSLYKRVFEIIQQQLIKPDIYVYLHVSTDRLLENIKMRGRGYERDISKDYLDQIQKSYFDFIKTYKEITFLVIDVNNIDFVNRQKDYYKIKNVILEGNFDPGMNMIIL